tara:strand:+ start:33966 stop:34184 length:219 start_codon:yes stop_codon:yes gene_type:complete
MKRIHTIFRCALLVLGTFVISGCGGEPQPEATSVNELSQFLADNPDIVEQSRLEEEMEDQIANQPAGIEDEL